MPANADDPTYDYAETFYSLRAPRVAIVFPADTEDWHFFAKSALWRANQLWGGAGFVLVPHHAGLVKVAVLRAVTAYDPDYVVGHNVSWTELLAAYPSSRESFVDMEGNSVDFETLTYAASDELARDIHTEAARDAVAAACQVYRRRDADSHDAKAPRSPRDPAEIPHWDAAWGEPDESNTFLQDPSHLTPITAFNAPDEFCVAAPADLGGPWGVWAAAIAGAVERPRLPATSPTQPADADELTAWFYSRVLDKRLGFEMPPSSMVHSPSKLKLGVDMGAIPYAWTQTTRGLVTVRTRYAPEQLTLVVGDTADDFAIALIWDRMWGNTMWIHSKWAPSAADAVGLRARAAASRLRQRIQRVRRAVVTTVSADSEILDDLCTAVNRTGERIEISAWQGELGEPEATDDAPKAKERPRRQLIRDLHLDFRRPGATGLAVKEEFSIQTTVPVLRDDGSTAMTTTPAAMRPTDPDLVGFDLNWHVDVKMAGEKMPLGRGLDGHALVTNLDPFETWIRSGSRGVSYENKRYDWISSGANTEQRLARPRIRFLAMREWCKAMAIQNGYEAEWSDAGRRAWLLQRMVFGRDQLINLVSGRFADLGAAFNREGPTTDKAYPDGIGVYLTGVGGFLTFTGMRSILVPPRQSTHTTVDVSPEPSDQSAPEDTDPDERNRSSTGPAPNLVARAAEGTPDAAVPVSPAPAETPDELEQGNYWVRRQVDRLVRQGVLRRGLILGCATCGTAAFVAVGDLSQQNECRRCGAHTDLTVDAWRSPSDEPTWFYDLHPVARKFFQDNGHAPLWLAHYLSNGTHEYADCAELNLLRPDTAKPLAEADLIANIDGVLVTAEVKTSNTLGNKAERNKAAQKRVRWAAVLQADEVILATTAPEWEKASVDAVREHLKTAIIGGVFSPSRPPALRLITGLHTSAVSDVYVNL
ncbi:hypothetical protein OH802_21400 [Nocardioides sp. NBC_00850]|uniref:hypothetical protein n=1 Tax=Nocardioides sp. NBC_00850 TaxID=2976001 RepID=UPI00386777C6|nr:hypothetical protein OH802_21400 [Nocardioides sp. NBC_00850]